LKAVLQRVSADRLAWIGPARRQGAFLEERLGDFDRRPGQDAVGIVRVAPAVADLQVSSHRERPSRELKKTLPAALRRAQMAVPGPFLELMMAGPEAQSSARLPELPWRLAKQMDGVQM
jgi:hypothetical protein